jgi:hypothetical protein
MSNVRIEEVLELESRIINHASHEKMYEQYVKKLIELLGVRIQVFITTAEVLEPFLDDVSSEMFRFCTAPLAARHEAATFALAQFEM